MSFIKRKGLPFIICAPSGTGKTTLTKKLCEEFPLSFSISCTTREPRVGEVEGKDYYFLDKKTFEEKKDQGEFAEWACVHGNYYGTPLKPLQERLESGQDILFDIDVQGAAQLSSSLVDAKFVFIYPPSLTILEERLVSRATDTQEAIVKRLVNARLEIKESHWFDAWIVNDNLNEAYDALRSFYISCTLSPRLHTDWISKLLSK